MSEETLKNTQSGLRVNHATRIVTATLGIMFAVAGLEHGFFEALQGSKPTDGLVIQAIGKSMQMWKYGSEEAFTIIPDFLVTGILAMSVSVFIIVWSLFFVHKIHGRTVFLLSFIVLTLVGGGIGFVPFFLVTWAYATRMNKPLTWWGKILDKRIRRPAAAIWPFTLTAAVMCWIIILEIAVFGYFPGLTDPETLSNIVLVFLLFTMIFINLSFVSGFAHDVENGISDVNPS